MISRRASSKTAKREAAAFSDRLTFSARPRRQHAAFLVEEMLDEPRLAQQRLLADPVVGRVILDIEQRRRADKGQHADHHEGCGKTADKR